MTPTAQMPGPKRQCLDALAKANDTRSARAELKKMLKAGDVSLRAVFYWDIPWLRTMRIADLIAACPRMGQYKAQRALRANGLRPTTVVFAVSKPCRNELLRWLVAHHPLALSRQPMQRGSLTKAQVKRIRLRARNGEVRRKLAEEHGVSEGHIYSVIA